MNTSTEKSCILFLDHDPKLAALALFDGDLQTSILYLAIVVSSVLREFLPEFDWKKEGYTIYRADVEIAFDHDLRWLASSNANWEWSAAYFKAMCQEYEYRFGSKHPSHEIIDLFDGAEPEKSERSPDFNPPPFINIPDEHHVDLNFRTPQIFKDKKGKGKWSVNPLNTNRQLYKDQFNSQKVGHTYTKRDLPGFLAVPTPTAGSLASGGGWGAGPRRRT